MNDIKLYKKVYAEGLKPTSDTCHFCSIYYIRYNNDCLLGLTFEKKTAKIIIHEIQVFLKSDIHMECYGFNLKCGYSELFCFLGFKIGGYPLKFSKKSQLLIRLNKIKASLQRKKIAESEKYFKLVEQMSSKMHRRVLDSVGSTGQTVFKQLQYRNLGNRSIEIKILNALKLSLYQMESEVSVLTVTPDACKVYKDSLFIPTFVGRRKENSLVVSIKKWVQKAMDLIKEEDKIELESIIGCYLSPKFVQARETYRTELGKILSKNFNKYGTKIKKVRANNRKVMLSKVRFCSIKILLPLECLKKKLRDIGVLHNISTRPVGKPVFSRLKDYEIIS